MIIVKSIADPTLSVEIILSLVLLRLEFQHIPVDLCFVDDGLSTSSFSSDGANVPSPLGRIQRSSADCGSMASCIAGFGKRCSELV